MANILSGPNFNVNKESKGSAEVLSTEDLLNPVREGAFPTSNSVYYTPYLDSTLYTAEQSNFTEPITRLNSIAYATSLVSQSGADLGVDYTDYANFVHFGSAQERLEHFKDKLESIQYHASQSLWIETQLTASAQYETETTEYHLKQADILVSEFDAYDRHLFFGSGSTCWPKDSNGVNLSTSATSATTWYNTQKGVAEEFDTTNQNRLLNTLPDFIKEDDINSPALVFCDMLGQHYDSILVYAQSISEKHNTDNRLNIGASRDLLKDILKGLGVKLYRSQFQTSDLGRLYTGQFYPTGSEDINTMVSASADIPSTKDYLDEVNKRLFHNIPHLLQVKGTKRGLRALVNAFGVPSDILPIREFGGTTSTGQNFGPADFVEDTTDKIRTDNTGSLLEGNTLSFYSTVESKGDEYTKDNHILEIGWSPNDLKNEYLRDNLPSSFNIDNFLGDPRDAFKKSYTDLHIRIKSILSTQEDRTIYDFLRLLKYFDNQMFAMLEDFAPARASIRKGAIIKPHLLERNKAGLGAMEVSNLEYSGSIDVVEVTGSEGGVIDEDTSHTYINKTKSGAITETSTDQAERFTGELGGSVITTTTGELNSDNPLKKSSVLALNYDVTVMTSFDTFPTASIASGDMIMYYKDQPLQLQVNPQQGPQVLPIGTTAQDIDLQILQTNPLVDGIGVSVTAVNSLVYGTDSTLYFSTTQAGFYDITDNVYSGDVFIVEAYAYDTGNPAGNISIELLNGGTSQVQENGVGSLTVQSDQGDFTVVSGSDLIIRVEIS